jgi:hypothetical protein
MRIMCSMQRWLLGISIPILIAHMSAAAEELRVDTDIYVGNQKDPLAQNVTLFSNGLVYDFCLMGSEEITVFDPDRGRFVILDPQRKVKAVVTTRQLLEFTAAIKVKARDVEGVFAFAANPEFSRNYDADSGWLSLTGDQLTYRARCVEPKSEELVPRYRAFADWSARLNAMRPGSLPPFARMELNAAIAESGKLPREVELTIQPQQRLMGRKLTIRSQHLLNWRLSQTDQKRIESAGKHLAEYETVSWEQYQQDIDLAAK